MEKGEGADETSPRRRVPFPIPPKPRATILDGPEHLDPLPFLFYRRLVRPCELSPATA